MSVNIFQLLLLCDIICIRLKHSNVVTYLHRRLEGRKKKFAQLLLFLFAVVLVFFVLLEKL